MRRHPDPPPETGHPTQALEDRFPADSYLRQHDFAILRRPARGEPIWTRGGKEFGEARALRIADREVREKRERNGGL